jgi:ATP synthase protein I
MSESKGSAWVLIGVGTILSSMIVAGFLLGYGVDRWLDSQPIFMILFGGLGLGGGILKVYKLLSRLG